MNWLYASVFCLTLLAILWPERPWSRAAKRKRRWEEHERLEHQRVYAHLERLRMEEEWERAVEELSGRGL